MAATISYTDFETVDIRVGTIIDAQPFPEARKPAIKLTIDFGGEIGVKKSSAQLTVHYQADRLLGRGIRDHDAAGGNLLFLQALDDHSVVQGAQCHNGLSSTGGLETFDLIGKFARC